MKKQTVLNKKKKGFTLIELIIVMAIMAILAAIAIPKFTEFKNTANKKHDITTGRTIANVVNTLNANGSFSGTITNLDINSSNANATLIAGMLENGAPKAKTTAVKDNTFYVTISTGDSVKVTTGANASSAKEVYPTPDDIFK